MNLDDLLLRYFGSSDVSTLTPAAQVAGVEHAWVDLGLEQDPRKRFALWAMLYFLDQAPDLDVVFKDEAEREAARNFMDLLAAADPDSGE